MHQNTQSSLKVILHPYIFVLKEGQKIKKDFLDYSLMMLFTHSLEKINSPENYVPKIGEAEKDFIDLPF